MKILIIHNYKLKYIFKYISTTKKSALISVLLYKNIIQIASTLVLFEYYFCKNNSKLG